MHTQPDQSKDAVAELWLASGGAVSDALTFLGEQVAAPEDQLARYLDCSRRELRRLTGFMETEELVERRPIFVREAPWIWLSHAGARMAGPGVRYRVPAISSLAHRRAINETRLYLRERAPDGIWVPERVVQAGREAGEHLPDAIFEVVGERHAIEVELSHKSWREIVEIVAAHSERYDAVVYFCGPGALPLMCRVKDEGRWPKLAVCALPGGE